MKEERKTEAKKATIKRNKKERKPSQEKQEKEHDSI